MPSSAARSPLDGLWQMIRAEHAGERAPEMVAHRTTLELSEGVYRVRFDHQIVDEGTFQTSDSAIHQILRFSGTAGTNNGRVIVGIFQLVRDRLRVCYGLDGFQPAEFTTAAGEKRYLATYRRISL